jgi:cytochrome c oxidase subunit IV
MQTLKNQFQRLSSFIADFIRTKLGLMIWGLLITILMGAGIWVSMFLRSLGLDYGTIVIPGLIVEVFGALFAYQLAQNFLPKEKKTERSEPSDLPQRKAKRT